MPGYLFDTSVISAFLDAEHSRYDEIREAVAQFDPADPQYLSAISLAETAFGVRMAEAFKPNAAKRFKEVLRMARRRTALAVTRNTAMVYARLKTDLAKRYLANASRQGRPRWVEDWVDKTTGKKLQIDENDLWMCAQAKERDLVLVTTDGDMQRHISKADPALRFLVLCSIAADSDSSVRPERTRAAIFWRNPGEYRGLDLCIVGSSFPKDQVPTKTGQLH